MLLGYARPWRACQLRRGLAVVAAAMAFLAVLSVKSSQVIPAGPTALSLNQGWSPETTTRAAFPLLNNLFVRVLPDPEAVAFFRARGLPWSPELQGYSGKFAFVEDYRFLKDQSFRAVHIWVAEHGARTYVLWLLHHPIARSWEVVARGWSVVTSPKLPKYMPPGWKNVGIQLPWFLLLGLLPLAVFAAVKARGTFLGALAAIITVSGIAGWVAAYYGDALEIPRHCYGSGQQVLLGLALCLLAWLENVARTRTTAGAPSRHAA